MEGPQLSTFNGNTSGVILKKSPLYNPFWSSLWHFKAENILNSVTENPAEKNFVSLSFCLQFFLWPRRGTGSVWGGRQGASGNSGLVCSNNQQGKSGDGDKPCK